MRCEEIRRKIAIYRELPQKEQERVRAHLAQCPDCAVLFQTYRAQDELLSSLPALEPSAEFKEAVLEKTTYRTSRRPRYGRRLVAVVLATFAILAVIISGTLQVAAGALPGDALYPVKRTAEQVRLNLTIDAAARARYKQELAQERREEVREVVALERETTVAFEGKVESVQDGIWMVNDLEVKINKTWQRKEPPVGGTVRIEADTKDGQIVARRVEMAPPETKPSPTQVRPTPSPAREATSTATREPTKSPTKKRSATRTMLPSDRSIARTPESRPTREKTPQETIKIRTLSPTRKKATEKLPSPSTHEPTRTKTPPLSDDEVSRKKTPTPSTEKATRWPTPPPRTPAEDIVASPTAVRTRVRSTPTRPRPSIATAEAAPTEEPVLTAEPTSQLEPTRERSTTIRTATASMERTPVPVATATPAPTRERPATRPASSLVPTPGSEPVAPTRAEESPADDTSAVDDPTISDVDTQTQ